MRGGDDAVGDIADGQCLVWAPTLNALARIPVDARGVTDPCASTALARLAVTLARGSDTAIACVARDDVDRKVPSASVFIARPHAIAVVLPAGWHCFIHGGQDLADTIAILVFVGADMSASAGTVVARPGVRPDIVRGRIRVCGPGECGGMADRDMAVLRRFADAMHGVSARA